MSARPVLLAAVVAAVVALYAARVSVGLPWPAEMATDAVLPILAAARLFTRRTRRCAPCRNF